MDYVIALFAMPNLLVLGADSVEVKEQTTFDVP